MAKYTLTQSKNDLEAISHLNKKSFEQKFANQKNYSWFNSHPVELLRLTEQSHQTDYWHNALNKPYMAARIANKLSMALIASMLPIGIFMIMGVIEIGEAYLYIISAILMVYYGLNAIQHALFALFLKRYSEVKNYLKSYLKVDTFDARLRFENPMAVIGKEALKTVKNYTVADSPDPTFIANIKTQLNDKYAIDRLTEEYLFSLNPSSMTLEQEVKDSLIRQGIDPVAELKESEKFKEITEDFRNKKIADLNDDEELAMTLFMPDINRTTSFSHKFIANLSAVAAALGFSIYALTRWHYLLSPPMVALLSIIVCVALIFVLGALVIEDNPSNIGFDSKSERKKISKSIRNYNHLFDKLN